MSYVCIDDGAPEFATTLDLLGISVRLEVTDPAAAAHVSRLVAAHRRCRRRPQRLFRLWAGDRGWVLTAGGEVVRAAMQAPDAVAMLLWSLNQVAMSSRDCATIHAGCVGRDGHGLVLSGAMEVGKSTLVTALVGRGWDYLSDEIAAVSLADGRLRAYPCPIALDPGSFPLFAALQPRVSAGFEDPLRWHLPVEIGVGATKRNVAPAALVFPRFAPEERSVLGLLSPIEALRLLASQAFNLQSLGGRGFRALARLRPP